jgi:hypothetical protein
VYIVESFSGCLPFCSLNIVVTLQTIVQYEVDFIVSICNLKYHVHCFDSILDVYNIHACPVFQECVETMVHLTCSNMPIEKIDHALETIN